MLEHLIVTDIGEIEIIKADSSDAPLLVELLIESAQWIQEKGIDQWRPEYFSIEQLLQYLKGREVYKVVLDGALIGTFAMQWSDPDIWKSLDNDMSGYLHRFTVKRIYAGKGIGAKLLNWTAEYTQSQGKQFIRLDCMANNDGLNSFYRKSGFTYIATVDLNGWSANLYEKELQLNAY